MFTYLLTIAALNKGLGNLCVSNKVHFTRFDLHALAVLSAGRADPGILTDQVHLSVKGLSLLTLRAPLSGTFLQTLPDIAPPLKGHSIFISAQLSSDAVSALRKVRVLI